MLNPLQLNVVFTIFANYKLTMLGPLCLRRELDAHMGVRTHSANCIPRVAARHKVKYKIFLSFFFCAGNAYKLFRLTILGFMWGRKKSHASKR